ncbi:hypothetical protein SLE2022_306740 [Rubroshorea leprosula]
MVTSADPLASSTWEKVSPKDTLISPVQCKSLWRQFKTETEYTLTQAISAKEAHERRNKWLPSPWSIVAIVVFGIDVAFWMSRKGVSKSKDENKHSENLKN